MTADVITTTHDVLPWAFAWINMANLDRGKLLREQVYHRRHAVDGVLVTSAALHAYYARDPSHHREDPVLIEQIMTELELACERYVSYRRSLRQTQRRGQ